MKYKIASVVGNLYDATRYLNEPGREHWDVVTVHVQSTSHVLIMFREETLASCVRCQEQENNESGWGTNSEGERCCPKCMLVPSPRPGTTLEYEDCGCPKCVKRGA